MRFYSYNVKYVFYAQNFYISFLFIKVICYFFFDSVNNNLGVQTELIAKTSFW